MIWVGTSSPDRPRRRRFWWLPSLRTINWVLLVNGLLVVGVIRLQLAPYIWKQRIFVPAAVLLLALVALSFVWVYCRRKYKTLATMTLVCLAVVAAAGIFVFRAVPRLRAVSAIHASGGAAGHDGQITVGPFRFTAPQWLPTPVTDVFCDRIWNVQLRGPGATDKVLAQLAVLEDVEDVSLSNSSITPTGLARLRGHPSLRAMSISSMPLGDDGLQALAAISTVNALNLDSCKGITDASLAHLRKLPNLQVLVLSKLPIGDDGLKQVARIPSLSQLYFSHCPVSDAGLANLPQRGRIRLTRIGLDETNVTPNGFDRLVQAAPGVWIRYEPSPALRMGGP